MGERQPQNLDEHPIASMTDISASIPVIDFSDLSDTSADGPIEEMARACEEWGFFQVINHSIAPKLIDNVWRDARRFFGQSIGKKESILRSRENPWGYYNN